MSAFDPKRTLASQSRVTGSWGIDGGSASLHLDVEGPDKFAPLLRFVGDEFAKVSGRKRERVATQIGKPRLVLPIGEGSVDPGICAESLCLFVSPNLYCSSPARTRPQRADERGFV